MSLGIAVVAVVYAAIVVIGAAGYLIERSAERNEHRNDVG